MNLDISMFFKFPGILVIIGVVLIITAIVIGIIAVIRPEKEVETDEIVEEDYNVEVVKLIDEVESLEPKQEVVAEPVNLIKDNVIPAPIDDSTILEETEDLESNEEDFLDTREFVILDKEEKKDNLDVETL